MHIYFAPLEGITTYPYRNLHHKYFGGVEKYFTPFLAPGPEQGMSVKEMRDVLPENNAGIPVVPQILTNRAGDFLLASKKLSEMGYREINLNPDFFSTRMIWTAFLMRCFRMLQCGMVNSSFR